MHCYGYLEILNDEDNQRAMDKLILKYEPDLLNRPDMMPPDYQAKLRSGVVGFKITVDEIHAKEKLGQHRKTEDQLGVVSGLQQSDTSDAVHLLAYMLKRNVGTGY